MRLENVLSSQSPPASWDAHGQWYELDLVAPYLGDNICNVNMLKSRGVAVDVHGRMQVDAVDRRFGESLLWSICVNTQYPRKQENIP